MLSFFEAEPKTGNQARHPVPTQTHQLPSYISHLSRGSDRLIPYHTCFNFVKSLLRVLLLSQARRGPKPNNLYHECFPSERAKHTVTESMLYCSTDINIKYQFDTRRSLPPSSLYHNLGHRGRLTTIDTQYTKMISSHGQRGLTTTPLPPLLANDQKTAVYLGT